MSSPDQRIDLAERERRRRVPLEIAADEAVVGDVQLEGGGTGGVDDGRAVLLDEAEDAEDPAHAGFALAAVDRRAQRADVRARPGGLRQQGQRARRCARRAIVGMDRVAPAHGVASVLAQRAGRCADRAGGRGWRSTARRRRWPSQPGGAL